MERVDEPLDPLDLACSWIFAAHRGLSQGGAFDAMMPHDIKAYLLAHVDRVNSIPVYGPSDAVVKYDPLDNCWTRGFAEGYSCGVDHFSCEHCRKERDR